MRRKLAAILTADVVDFSRRMSEDEVGTLAAVRGLIEREIQPAVAERNGTVFKTLGDGVLAIFDSAVEAVDCAAAPTRLDWACARRCTKPGAALSTSARD